MNCFDCAARGQHTQAVAVCAVCAGCGAALCHDHAHVTARWLKLGSVGFLLIWPVLAGRRAQNILFSGRARR